MQSKDWERRGNTEQSQETNNQASGAESAWKSTLHNPTSQEEYIIHNKTSLILIIAGGDIMVLPPPSSEVNLAPSNIWEAQSHFSP